MKTLRISLAGAALLTVGSGLMMLGQRGSTPPPQPPPSSRTTYPSMSPMTPMGGMDSTGAPDVLSSRMAEQQVRSRNMERQKRLESDTDKLMGLVTDFKEQVDKGLSPADMSKKAEEIEKLARSVKDKMKG